MNEFSYQSLRKISNDFDKISLFFQTVSKSEATSLLPTRKGMWQSEEFPHYLM